MNEIRKLVWNGELNIQVSMNPSIRIVNDLRENLTANIRVPRNAYIVFYLESILEKFKNHLNIDIKELEDNSFFWFEHERVPLYWNYPIGVLYDTLTFINPEQREIELLKDDYKLPVWKLELNYGLKIPSGVIPLIEGMEQVRKYWMHQWKQVCYILNGSSKKMMSFSMSDTERFWNSVRNRNISDFYELAKKIIPMTPRHIPIIIHTNYPKLQQNQPLVVYENDKTSQLLSLRHLFKTNFKALFEDNSVYDVRCVSNGIAMPLDMLLLDVYLRFMSLDGFLHLALCLSPSTKDIKNEQY